MSLTIGNSRRTLARLGVGCQKCGVPPGVACEGVDGRARKSVHQQRITSASTPQGRIAVATVTGNPADPFYYSRAWKFVRYEVLKRSRGCCELCGMGPTVRKPLHVDHIKPRSRFPDLELDLTNLQVLCADCNLGKGARDCVDWRRSLSTCERPQAEWVRL